MSQENSTLNGQYGTALYYPHIHVRDTNWLKTSLLYWDNLVRIAPTNYSEADDSLYYQATERELVNKLVAANLLIKKDPTDYLENASQRFMDKLPRLLAANSGYQKESIEECFKAVLEDGKDLTYSERCAIEDQQVYDLYKSKVDHGLETFLLNTGLAYERDQMLYVKTSIGVLYMSCLASVMSEKMSAPALTDKAAYSEFAQLMESDLLPLLDPAAHDSSVLFNLAIPLPPMKALQKISADELIEFHQQTGEQRRNYREAIRSIALRAAEAGSIDELREDAFLRLERSKVAEFKAAYESRWKIFLPEMASEFLTAGMCTSSVFQFFAPHLPIEGHSVAIGAGMIAGVSKAAYKWHSSRKMQESKSPWYYHYQMKKLTNG